MATPVVETVKVVAAEPAGTVTVLGTVAFTLLDVKATEDPPAGADPLSVTVQVDGFPPATEVGDNAMLATVSGKTVSVVCLEPPAYVADTIAGVLVETAEVVTVNVAVDALADTVTLFGTKALRVFVVRDTTMPPLGAFPLSVTVPVALFPPSTELGEILKLWRLGRIVKGVVTVWFCHFPVMFAVPGVEPATVVTVKFADVEPPGIVTFAGGTALALFEDSDTTMPPDGAAPLSETVPVEGLPPTTDVGVRENPVIAKGVMEIVVVNALGPVPTVMVAEVS